MMGDCPYSRLDRTPMLSREEVGTSFALAVEPVELVEARRELVREVQHWLTVWERSRDVEARGRLVQSLELLRLLVAARR